LALPGQAQVIKPTNCGDIGFDPAIPGAYPYKVAICLRTDLVPRDPQGKNATSALFLSASRQ